MGGEFVKGPALEEDKKCSEPVVRFLIFRVSRIPSSI